MPDDALRPVLLDFLYELREKDIPLMIGGGYGLFLKREHLARSSYTRTLLPPKEWAQARATNDIDLLLRPEILVAPRHMAALRETLDRLAFEPVEGAEYYQFEKTLGPGRAVRFDFLTGPSSQFANRQDLRMDSRRIRPRQSVGLHAHPLEEAIAYDKEATTVPVTGLRSNGDAYSAEILVPQAFTYMLMKLFAFRDRKDDPDKDMARHHALDLYRVAAMMTDVEYEMVRRLAMENREDGVAREASRIAADFFSSSTALGVLRIREHPLYSDDMDIEEVLRLLAELFPRAE
ncbi:MAG: hypothetical protein ACRD1X_20965 [Vicinamibacteria bacterium]